MVITVRAVFIAFLVGCHVLSERLFALFAHEHHLGRFCEFVGLGLGMTFGTVEPPFAAWRTD